MSKTEPLNYRAELGRLRSSYAKLSQDHKGTEQLLALYQRRLTHAEETNLSLRARADVLEESHTLAEAALLADIEALTEKNDELIDENNSLHERLTQQEQIIRWYESAYNDIVIGERPIVGIKLVLAKMLHPFEKYFTRKIASEVQEVIKARMPISRIPKI